MTDEPNEIIYKRLDIKLGEFTVEEYDGGDL